MTPAATHAMMAAPAGASILHVVARIGGEAFAFPVAAVDEVLDAPPIDTVPSAPAGMLGQLQHRGRMIGAWDGTWAFGFTGAPRGRQQAAAPGDAARATHAALVLRDGLRRNALIVDDVLDVAHVAGTDMHPVPAGADPDGALSGLFFAARPRTGRGSGIVSVVRVESLNARFAAMTVSTGAIPR